MTFKSHRVYESKSNLKSQELLYQLLIFLKYFVSAIIAQVTLYQSHFHWLLYMTLTN